MAITGDKKSVDAATPHALDAPVITTGETTSGRIAKFASASTITNSILTEDSGKIGIGTDTPTTTLTVINTAVASPAVLGSDNGPGGIGMKGESNSTADSAVGVLGLINP